MTYSVSGYDLQKSTNFQRFGRLDPTCRRQDNIFVRAFWTPEGPCTLALRQEGEQIQTETVGEGAAWCQAWLPRMFEFRPQELPGDCAHRGLVQMSRESAGMRVGAVPWIFELTINHVFQQRVTFQGASRSYRELTEQYGERAPGPLSLRMPLSPRQWLAVGLSRIQAAGLDEKRASTLLRVAELGLGATEEALSKLRGIGPWTLANVQGFGFGDPDAVPVGDVHIPRLVCKALRDDGSRWCDERMVELLEPYRGLRFRVIRWILRG